MDTDDAVETSAAAAPPAPLAVAVPEPTCFPIGMGPKDGAMLHAWVTGVHSDTSISYGGRDGAAVRNRPLCAILVMNWSQPLYDALSKSKTRDAHARRTLTITMSDAEADVFEQALAGAYGHRTAVTLETVQPLYALAVRFDMTHLLTYLDVNFEAYLRNTLTVYTHENAIPVLGICIEMRFDKPATRMFQYLLQEISFFPVEVLAQQLAPEALMELVIEHAKRPAVGPWTTPQPGQRLTWTQMASLAVAWATHDGDARAQHYFNVLKAFPRDKMPPEAVKMLSSPVWYAGMQAMVTATDGEDAGPAPGPGASAAAAAAAGV